LILNVPDQFFLGNIDEINEKYFSVHKCLLSDN